MISNNQMLNTIIKKEIKNINNSIDNNKMKRGEKLLRKYLDRYDNILLFLTDDKKEFSKSIESIDINIKSSILYKKIIKEDDKDQLKRTIEFLPKETSKLRSEFQMIESLISDLIYKNKLYLFQYPLIYFKNKEKEKIFKILISEINYILYNDFSPYLINSIPMEFDDHLMVTLSARDFSDPGYFTRHGYPIINLENPLHIINRQSGIQLKKMIYGIINQMIYDYSNIEVIDNEIVCSIKSEVYDLIYSKCESRYICDIIGFKQIFLINRYVDILKEHFNLDDFLIHDKRKNSLKENRSARFCIDKIFVKFQIIDLLNKRLFLDNKEERNE